MEAIIYPVEALNRITRRYKQVNLHWLLTGNGNMFFDEPDSAGSQMNEDQVVYGKGRLEELEARVERLEALVKEMMRNIRL